MVIGDVMKPFGGGLRRGDAAGFSVAIVIEMSWERGKFETPKPFIFPFRFHALTTYIFDRFHKGSKVENPDRAMMAGAADRQKKEQIKQAARQLFFQFGFSKTSMEDIARESNLAKPTLYYYYANKEALFDEIVIEEARLFIAGIQRQVPADEPADRRMAAFLRHGYGGLKRHARAMAGLPAYFCEHSPHGHPIVRKLDDLFRVELEALVREGQEAGIFAEADPTVMATTLVWMTDFINLDWLRQYPEPLRDQAVDLMIDTLLNGIKRRPE